MGVGKPGMAAAGFAPAAVTGPGGTGGVGKVPAAGNVEPGAPAAAPHCAQLFIVAFGEMNPKAVQGYLLQKVTTLLYGCSNLCTILHSGPRELAIEKCLKLIFESLKIW